MGSQSQAEGKKRYKVTISQLAQHQSCPKLHAPQPGFPVWLYPMPPPQTSAHPRQQSAPQLLLQAQPSLCHAHPSLTAAHGGVPQVLGWVTVEEGSAEFTVAPSCVVLTFVTHTSTHVARCQVYGHVEVAAMGVPMALTLLGEGREGQGRGLLRDHVSKVGGPSAP